MGRFLSVQASHGALSYYIEELGDEFPNMLVGGFYSSLTGTMWNMHPST